MNQEICHSTFYTLELMSFDLLSHFMKTFARRAIYDEYWLQVNVIWSYFKTTENLIKSIWNNPLQKTGLLKQLFKKFKPYDEQKSQKENIPTTKAKHHYCRVLFAHSDLFIFIFKNIPKFRRKNTSVPKIEQSSFSCCCFFFVSACFFGISICYKLS